MADNPSPPPNTSKVKKRKKAEQNNTSDDDADAEFIARYTKIVTDMKKAKIMFPRFLLMMSGDEDKSLSRLSTFAIQKGIEGLVGEPKNIKRLRSGDLLIEVDRETYSTKLLAIKEIAGIPVKVSPHRTLNTSRGGGCYLHVVPLVTSFRRLNTPSTCLPWVASRIGGRRDPGG